MTSRALVAVLLALSCWAADHVATRLTHSALAPALAAPLRGATDGAGVPDHHDDARLVSAGITVSALRSPYQHLAAAAASVGVFVAAVGRATPPRPHTRPAHPGLRDIPLLI